MRIVIGIIVCCFVGILLYIGHKLGNAFSKMEHVLNELSDIY